MRTFKYKAAKNFPCINVFAIKSQLKKKKFKMMKFVCTCKLRHTVAKGDMKCPSEGVQCIKTTSRIV